MAKSRMYEITMKTPGLVVSDTKRGCDKTLVSVNITAIKDVFSKTKCLLQKGEYDRHETKSRYP